MNPVSSLQICAAAGRARRSALPTFVVTLIGCCAAWSVVASSIDVPPPDAGVSYWNSRLASAMKAHDAAEELRCLGTLLRNWGTAFSDQSETTVTRVLLDARAAGVGQERLEVLRALFELRWRTSIGLEPSPWWRELSLSLWEQGQQADALLVAAHITNPYDVMVLHVDNRYRPLLKAPGLETNVNEVLRRDLDTRRALVQSRPHRLDLLVSLARGLLYARRPAEALQLMDQALQKSAEGAVRQAYVDTARELPFVYQVRGQALFELGRYDEAIEHWRHALTVVRPAPPSLHLALAWGLSSMGKPKEALEVLPADDTMNFFSRTDMQELRAGIACQTGDTEAQTQALDILRQQQDVAPGPYEHALILCDRLAEAAGVLSSRLADPRQRADALRELQDYAMRQGPALLTRWRTAVRGLSNRGEIRAQIAAVGKIERVSLSDVNF